MVTLEFTMVEVELIARLTGNLMASALDAGLNAGVLEAIYCKANQCLADGDKNCAT